jgi:DNA repair protein RecN (Recombination protein N)
VLTELRVRDLGVIEDLSLTFRSGMTVLTGETGAGKTLVVEALQLVMGGRANPTMVRAGATEALVEARFELEPGAEPVAELDGEQELVIARAVPADGRSRAWINGRMTPLSQLSEVASQLVELHGQHEHRTLATPAAQRGVLDLFAGTDLGPIENLRRELRQVAESVQALGGDGPQRAREADVLRYQWAEIDAAHLEDPDEDHQLRLEEERLADASSYLEAAVGALALLDPEGGGGTETQGTLGSLSQAVITLGDRESFEEYADRLKAAVIELSDVARSLRDVVDGWEDDPARLGAVQGRRRLLADLRRKYGEDVAAVIAYGKQAGDRLAELDNAEALGAELEARRLALTSELHQGEAVVRAVRAAAAEEFARVVGERLGDLAMGGSRVEVRLAEAGTGEPVEIALGANVGEAVLPLAKAASGGELARAMLAIRLVALSGPPTMVFDEVDAGVGGAAALALGQALHEVGRTRQVLVVTPLAQVAAQADHQISVEKRTHDGRTVTGATPVAGEERVVELSRMLSGHPDSDAAQAHARELLGSPPR